MEAVLKIDGPVLIIAGAGTGKTATLVARTANMLKKGINPKSILLLTFTNKAANEMRNRIMVEIGPKAAEITASM
jgi:DNA helicase-2/ATP-dependent DNA helicase PcrA